MVTGGSSNKRGCGKKTEVLYMFEKVFKLKEHNTKISTEIIAGITTFFAMAYIIFVNPNLLSATGMDYTATCLSAAIGTFLTAFIANVPFAQAPGMGLNAYFTYTIVLGMGYTWQQGLAIVLISGILFLLITVSPLRKMVIASIPAPLKSAIGAGIGLFIAFIGLLNIGLVQLGAVPSLGLTVTDAETGAVSLNMNAVLCVIGLLITGALMAWKVKGAMIIGIIVTTLIGIPMGITNFGAINTNISLAPTFLQLDFNLMTLGILPLITAIVTFAIVDMFDTVGTLIGTAGNAGMLDEDGNFPGGDRALLADAIATCTGACLGTSTVTTFVESSTGISEGGRTGLSSVVTGLLFLVAIVLAPIASVVPSASTAPALIIVGVLMMKSTKNIEWNDFEVALPCFLTISMMAFAYSISDGIGFGFISYVFIKMVRGKFKDVPVLLYILAAVFLLKYILTIVTSVHA